MFAARLLLRREGMLGVGIGLLTLSAPTIGCAGVDGTEQELRASASAVAALDSGTVEKTPDAGAPSDASSVLTSHDSGTVEGTPDAAAPAEDGGHPNLPILIALGDSVTSGHHGGGGNLVCDDPAYGYPATVFANLKANDGENWFQDEQYVNYAHSGFSTSEVINGGTNGCGRAFTSPLSAAQASLRAHLNPVVPNRVVMSVGANDTNWVTILTGVSTMFYCANIPDTKNTVLKITTAAQCEDLFKNGYNGPRAGQTPGIACNNIRFAAWDGPAKSNGIAQGITDIINGLISVDHEVNITLVNYYDPAGTGFVVPATFRPNGPYLPAVCTKPVADRIAEMAKWVADGSSNSGPSIFDIVSPTALNGANAMVQQLKTRNVFGTILPATDGWPHPNTAGHRTIGNLIVAP